MIELTQKDVDLIKKIESYNLTDYNLVEVKSVNGSKYIITIDDLLNCLEETQNYREYDEMKIKELTEAIDRSE